MKTNTVCQKLRAGQPSLGCFLSLGSPNVAELMANAGFEWLVIETEHNALDAADVQHMLMAMNGIATIPLVRIPSADPVYIQRSLDMGALGIVVPMVRTAAEAAAIVRATRYPPIGTRGFGPFRAANYSMDNSDYFQRANDNILVALILETKEAAENLASIAAVPGVDAIFLGPFDLSLAFGLDPLKQPHPEIEAVAERMLEIGKKTNVAMGMGVGSPEQLRLRRSQGFTFLAYGSDAKLILDGAQAGLKAFQS